MHSLPRSLPSTSSSSSIPHPLLIGCLIGVFGTLFVQLLLFILYKVHHRRQGLKPRGKRIFSFGSSKPHIEQYTMSTCTCSPLSALIDLFASHVKQPQRPSMVQQAYCALLIEIQTVLGLSLMPTANRQSKQTRPWTSPLNTPCLLRHGAPIVPPHPTLTPTPSPSPQ